VKGDDVSREAACIGKSGTRIVFSWQSQKVRYNWGDLDMGGRIILRFILER
jgi:hypothetical protein